jgi:hypothetical protein
MKKAIYEIRDRKLPEEIRKRIPEQYSGNSFIPPGWKNLVRMLDAELAEICPDYELHQAKSKFGTLRYYINFRDDDPMYNEMHDIIDKYEQLSAHTCEVCGQPAQKGANQWLVFTRCETHKE